VLVFHLYIVSKARITYPEKNIVKFWVPPTRYVYV